MFLKLYLLCILLVEAQLTELNGNCATKDQKTGTASFFKDCPELHKFRFNVTDEFLLLLKNRLLESTHDGKVLVCCNISEIPPDGSCVNPDAFTGSCIPLHACPKLSEMFARGPSLSQRDRQYLKNSQCGYHNNQAFVCCASDLNSSAAPLQGASGESSTIIKAPWKSKLPQAPKCGISAGSGVTVGRETNVGDYLWTVLLDYKKPYGMRSFNCGGSLINERYVLTAAHCLMKIPSTWELISVRVGEWNLNTDIDCDPKDATNCLPQPIDIAVTEKLVHPAYNVLSRGTFHDIALLRLAKRVPSRGPVIPICLPVEDDLRDKDYTGIYFTVAGWGKNENRTNTSTKRQLALPYFPKEDCTDVYRYTEKQIVDSQICAGAVKGQDTCSGDSGGPLMAKDPSGYWYLVGIVSFGPTLCGSEGIPGVYTKVGSYIDWIVANIRK